MIKRNRMDGQEDISYNKNMRYMWRCSMKVVIAIDSFKGSMSSIEAGEAARAGILKVCDAEITVKPLADGGEGTTKALVEGLGGEYVSVEVTGPLGKIGRAHV